MTDEALAAQPFVDDPDGAENALAALLEQAQAVGPADPDADARTEAISLLAMVATMGTGILVGQRSPEAVIAVFRHHLDRIFATPRAQAPEAGAGSN